MKTNFSKQLVKPQITTTEEADKAITFLYGHIQSLTDTINQIVGGGLSLSRTEQNLPLNLVRARVSSGISRTIPGYGASIVYAADGASVESFSYRTISDNSLEITVVFNDDKTHDIVFLVVNERLPT